MKKTKSVTLKVRVLRLLKSARGTQYRANEIARILGVREKHATAPAVRDAIRDLRFEGVGICSGPDGYWYSEKQLEIAETVNRMLCRSQAIIDVAKAMQGGRGDE